MRNLSFEELMEIFLKSKKQKDYEEILNVNKEFVRRVKKRELMGKNPMKTSMSGLEQTQRWLDNNSKLENKEIIKKKSKNKLEKLRKKYLREIIDTNKKNSLW